MKTCNGCGEVLPLDAFYLNPRGKFGVAPRCKSCQVEAAKRWKAANPERAKANNARHRAFTRELAAERTREWRKANPGRNLELVNSWRARNPERAAWQVHEYRARKLGASGRATVQQIQWRIEMFGGRCWMCDGPANTIDHVIALSRGGTNWPANLRPACRPCNSAKRDRVFVREAA